MPTSQELFDELREKSYNEDMSRENFYASIVAQVNEALAFANPAERDERMKGLYQDLTAMAARSALIRRGLMTWSDDMYAQYDGATFTSALSTSAHVEGLLREIIKESGSDYVCKENMGLSNEEYIDYIGRLATSVKMKDVQDEFFKQATAQSRENAMDKYAKELLDKDKEITYSGNFSSSNDRQIAGVYALYDNAWANIKKGGFFGNLFHPINFFKNVGLIRTANAIFNKVGFSVKSDGADAMDAFQSTADECAGRDLANLAELESSFKEDAKNASSKGVEEVRVARNKLENTIAAIQNGTMEHPMHKINAILGKYGASVSEDEQYRPGRIEGIATAVNEELLAEEYDRTRKTDFLEQYMKSVFFKGLNIMMDAAVENGKPLNISEIVKDASDIGIMMAKNYTVLYEEQGLRELAENSAFGSYDAEKIFGYVQKNLDKNKLTEKYDLDALKNEIEQTVKEYKNPTIEDYKAKENEEKVSESTEPQKTEEELIQKISVDLTYGETKIEQAQPKIEEKAPIEKQASV